MNFEVPRSRPQTTPCLLVGDERVHICSDIVVPKHGSFGSFEELGQDTRDSV